MWAKTTLNTSNCLFILNPDNYNDRCVGCAGYDNAGSSMVIFDYGAIPSGRSVYTGIPVDLSGWHHYVFIVSQSGNFKRIYRDGVKYVDDPYTLTCNNKNLPLQIGGGYDQGGGNIFFRGDIDDICIYNRALNDSEVVALYNNINTCFLTGINELSPKFKLLVYPTVSSDGIFRINSLENGSLIEVYTVEGKLILKLNYDVNTNNINLSSAPDGIYIIKAYNKNGIISERIMKMTN